MRLAIFARIENSPDLIPLDISIPDKDLSKFSLSDIAKHICAFAKISIPGSINPKLAYVMSKGGVILNPEVLLVENGIKNGDVVDLVIEHRKTYLEGYDTPSSARKEEIIGENQMPRIDATMEESDNATQISDIDETQYKPVPGKKIDFD